MPLFSATLFNGAFAAEEIYDFVVGNALKFHLETDTFPVCGKPCELSMTSESGKLSFSIKNQAPATFYKGVKVYLEHNGEEPDRQLGTTSDLHNGTPLDLGDNVIGKKNENRQYIYIDRHHYAYFKIHVNCP